MCPTEHVKGLNPLVALRPGTKMIKNLFVAVEKVVTVSRNRMLAFLRQSPSQSCSSFGAVQIRQQAGEAA